MSVCDEGFMDINKIAAHNRVSNNNTFLTTNPNVCSRACLCDVCLYNISDVRAM